MSYFNISQLPSATTLTGSEQLFGDQFGVSVAITVAQLAALASIGAGGLTGQVLYNLNGLQAGSTSMTFAAGSGTLSITNLVANTVVATESVTGSLVNGAYSYGTMQYADTGNLATFAIAANEYAQIQAQNYNTGSAASADFIVANSATTAATGYGDFGINGVGFAGAGSLGAPSYVYLYAAGTELAVGTSTANGIHFVTNSGATDAAGISAAGVFTIASLAYVNVTSNTVPQNGIYLSAPNTLAFASNLSQAGTLSAAGNWIFNAPASGATAAFTAAHGGNPTVNIVGDLTGTYALQLTSTSGTPRSWGFATSGANNALYLEDVTRGAEILSVSSAGDITMYAPASGITLSIAGSANAYAASINGNATSGQSFGLLIQAGTTSADYSFQVLNQTGATLYARMYGDGGMTFGSPTGGDKGIGTVNAAGMYVNGVAVSTGGSPGGASGNLQYDNGGSFGGVSNWNWTAASGVMVASAPTSGVALTINGFAGSYTESVIGAATSGSSFGLLIQAGYTSADQCFSFQTHGGTQILGGYGDGGITAGAPTGGDKGAGTINAVGLYVGGVAVSTGGAPGGASGLLQYNNGGSFGGATGWSYAGTKITANTGALSITAAANVVPLAITGGTNTANYYAATVQAGAAAGFSSGLYVAGGTNSSDVALQIINSAGTQPFLTINGAGNASIGATTAGVPFSVAVNASTFYGAAISAGAGVGAFLALCGNATTAGANSVDIGADGANNLQVVVRQSGASAYFTTGAQQTLTLYPSGRAAAVTGFNGTHSFRITDSAQIPFNAGYLEVPVNTQNANYTTVLADSAKAILHNDGVAYTHTIAANSSVAYPVGTTLTFVNDASAAVNITIAINTDTLVWTPSGSTGARTLAQYGRAVAHKVGATRWYISGTGLT